MTELNTKILEAQLTELMGEIDESAIIQVTENS